MNTKTLAGALTAAALLAVATPSLAHVTFEPGPAAVNSTTKAVLRIPHGCDGQATLKVRVRIPEGVIAVKPMPKAGWTLDTAQAPYAKPYTLYGQPVAEGVTEIVWTGSLPDAHYDEFVFQARITDAFQPGQTIFFPVVQECAGGQEAWTEIAGTGQDPHSLKMPAPGLKLAGAQVAAVRAGPLSIEEPWSRATPTGARVGGGYLRITNTGQASDRLVGGTFPLAGRVEVHEMSMDNNVMRMRALEGGLEIKPGETVELKPGGMHLMFVDLKEPLRENQSLKGTLVFEKAGPVEITYTVRGLGGAGAAEHKH